MTSSRRQFLQTAGTVGLASSLLHSHAGAASAGDPQERAAIAERQARIEAALRRPVLRRELFPEPVRIESIELLRWEKSFLCRVRSSDGAEGLSVAHGGMNELYPIFLQRVRPFFLGKDARDLDLLLERVFVFQFNFRFEGIALGIPLATLEFALLDMLGRIAGRSLGRLIGEIHHPKVAVYVATEWRERPLEETVERIRKAVSETDARALKIKVGYLMFMTKDHTARGPSGKSEKLIPLLRELYGPDMALYADANGYYEVDEAIRIGRLLEENKYTYFEEPVRYDDFAAIKRVADALRLPIANGEQDHSFVNFRWLLAHGGLEIVQPDSYYFGGLIRSVQVGRMAEACGQSIVPHMSGGGLGFLYNSHLVSVLPNAGAHHEFKGLQSQVPFTCSTSPLKVADGRIQVPTGPGLGVEIDPSFVQKHRPVAL